MTQTAKAQQNAEVEITVTQNYRERSKVGTHSIEINVIKFGSYSTKQEIENNIILNITSDSMTFSISLHTEKDVTVKSATFKSHITRTSANTRYNIIYDKFYENTLYIDQSEYELDEDGYAYVPDLYVLRPYPEESEFDVSIEFDNQLTMKIDY